MSEGERRIETHTVHAGQEPSEETGALMTPIYANSTYIRDGPGDHRNYEYSHTGNPTRTDLESDLAALEHGSYGRAFASGVDSINTVLSFLGTGNHVVAGNDVYGDTYHIFTQAYEKYGLEFGFVDTIGHDAARDVVSKEIELIWVETPTNPLMHINDISTLADIAYKVGALCVVDNTFTTPHLQCLPDHGAGIVSCPLTKYLDGHFGVVGGTLVTDDEELDEKLGFYQNSIGAIPSPFDYFLTPRGTKTLPARMDRHRDNAHDLATWFGDYKAVPEVFCPGLDSHPQHDLAAEQMDGFGGMLSFELDDPFERASTVVEGIGVLTLAESLDGVESLIEQPAAMTHAAVPREERLEAGSTDGLIRVPVDIERIDNMKADLQRAFGVVF